MAQETLGTESVTLSLVKPWGTELRKLAEEERFTLAKMATELLKDAIPAYRRQMVLDEQEKSGLVGVYSPVKGEITQIHVKPGRQVLEGQIIVSVKLAPTPAESTGAPADGKTEKGPVHEASRGRTRNPRTR